MVKSMCKSLMIINNQNQTKECYNRKHQQRYHLYRMQFDGFVCFNGKLHVAIIRFDEHYRPQPHNVHRTERWNHITLLIC